MKITTFRLPEVLFKSNPNININGSYPFKDGLLTVTEDVGRQIKNILTVCYECTHETVDVDVDQAQDSSEASLSKHLTQGGPTSSVTAADHVTQPKRDPEAPKSVTTASVEQGAAVAEAVKAAAQK